MQTIYLSLFLLIAVFLGCGNSKNALLVDISNPTSLDRENEIVEIAWEDVQQKLALTGNKKIIITDGSKQQVAYQLVTSGTDSVKLLILPVSVKAGQKATFQISEGVPDEFQPLVYGRLVPERKDDFAWENNRVAFRVYGPALQATGEISNGMDFWTKKTDSLIIDKWYKNDLAGIASYHQDHGEGLDFYKVGRTLGLGMSAPFNQDTLILGKNFVNAQILDNGPLRITIKFSYEPYDVLGKSVNETRIISLDAYSRINKVTNIFEVDSANMEVATGIVMIANKPEVTYGVNSGIIAYEVPADSLNGTIYTGVIHPGGFGVIKVADGHYLGLNSYRVGTPYTYYVGGGWSKAGFNTFDEWTKFLNEQKDKLTSPLKVEIK